MEHQGKATSPSLSLKTRVLLLVVGLLVAGIWGLALRVSAVLQADIEKLLSDQLSTTVDYIASDIDHKIELRFALLNEIAAAITPAILAEPAKVQRLLEQRNLSRALFPIGIFVTNKKGINVADYPKVPGRAGGFLGDHSWFGDVMSGRGQSIGTPLMGRFAKQPLVPIAVPIGEASAPVAVLVGTLLPSDPTLFGELEKTNLGKDGYLLVASPRDKLWISSSDKSRIMQPFPPKGANPLFDRRIEERIDVSAVTTSSRGVQVLSVNRYMKTTGWMVIAAVPTDEAFAPVAALKHQIYFAALLLSCAVALILRTVLVRQLAPLENAGAAMRRMTDGEEPFAPLPIARDDEIGRLVNNFNRLATERIRFDESRLRLAVQVERRERELQAIFNASPVPMSVSNIHERTLLDVNDAWLAQFQWRRDEVIGRVGGSLGMWQSEAERTRMLDDLRSGSLRTRGRMVRRDGTLFPAELATREVHIGDRGLRIWAYVDLSEIQEAQEALERLNHELEDRVAARSAELQRATEELMRSEKHAALGRLVAGVAHELNTPIGNSLLSATTLAARTEEFAREAVSGLRRSTLDAYVADSRQAAQILYRNLERAGNLISSFKQVAADQTSSQRRRFQLNELIEEVLLAHRPIIKKTAVVISSDVPLGIHLDSYPGPLGQVLSNVIVNVLHHGYDEHERGTLRISATLTEPDGVELTVRDQGRGISEHNLKQVFEPFFTTRLGRGGTGLGLSICHSLVTQVLGGEIRIESTFGAGTSVIIRVPRTAPGGAIQEAA